ncbi:hypothetical protein GCM10023093_27310 [Nemorincola caseinilytica]|uniref:DUF4190 domain-containing protein n=1 Tax=Nemorincola caseinilytica TaxID=2054315 RepID=A0ABP8NKL6_9BACT
MKIYPLLLLLASTLLLAPLHSHAGFLVKKQAPASSAAPSKKDRKKAERLADLATLHHLVLAKNEKEKAGKQQDKTSPPRDTSGWEGIVSLACGVIALIPFTFLLFIPAIIFGILGLRKGKQFRGLALAGLILGIIAIPVLLMLIALSLAGTI